MERFRAAHVTASKEIKKRKTFRNKVKNLLHVKATKNELLTRGKLKTPKLAVLPVDVSHWRQDPKRLKKIKTVEVQFIADVTSKILQSAEPVIAREDRSHCADASPTSVLSVDESEPEIIEEIKNDPVNYCYISLPSNSIERSDVETQDFSATLVEPFINQSKTSENENEESDGDNSSKTCGNKLRRRRNRKQSSAGDHVVSDIRGTGDMSAHCEENNHVIDDNYVHVPSISDASIDNGVAFDSTACVNLTLPDSKENMPSFDMEPHSTDVSNLEPLIIKSEGQNTMKALITERLKSVCRSATEDKNYVAQMTQNMKEILALYGNEPHHSLTDNAGVGSGVISRVSDSATYNINVPQTFVTGKFESLSIEESDDFNMSALRDVFRTYNRTQYMAAAAGTSDASDRDIPHIDIHCLANDRFLLILKSGDSVYVRGKLTVSVVGGCAEILGYKLKAVDGLKKYTVFSPRGVSLLSITACASAHNFAGDDVLHSLCADNQLPEDCFDSLGESDCILLLEKAESVVADYLSLHHPNKLFPSISSVAKRNKYSFAEKKLGCEFLSGNLGENVKLFCKRDEWDNLSGVILSQNCKNEANCTVICGGKGVGKSTLLRFLINRSLSSHEKILCLDFDVGQAEFTVPGCISAVIIKKPIFGPNFTHLMQPERMVFIGDVNVSHCPTQYLNGAKFIIDYCKAQAEFQHIPWFVNTMGFCKGLGVEIMMNLLHMVSPTDVIQIQSRSNKRNFPKHLDIEYVRYYKSSFKYFSCFNSNLSYDLHLIPSAAESKSEGHEAEWGLDSRTMREVVVMSYLSRIAAPPKFSLTEIVPYVCSFENLKLCVCHETINPRTILSVMNGNFVGLCMCDKEDMLQPSDPSLPCILLHAPVCQCLGFGVIRGVDIEKRQLYVISSLPEDEIQKVNCLVMGTVQLPSCVLLREAGTGIVGRVPYTIIGPGQPTGRLSKKSSCRLLLSSAVGQ